MLEGILWILRSGARWQDLPEEFPRPSTCWRRLRDWEEQERLAENLADLSGRAERTPTIEVERVVSGRQFRSGEKRGSGVGKTKRGKGTKWMVVVDGRVFLWETTFTLPPRRRSSSSEATLATIRVGRRHRAGRPRQKPVRLIADSGYDSDPLRKQLAARGIELIARIERTGASPRPRMAERCAAISGAGPSNAPSPGSATSAAWSCATTARSRFTSASFISPAS